MGWWRAPDRGPADRPREQHIPGQAQAGLAIRKAKQDRAPGVAGGVLDRDLQAGDLDRAAVRQLGHVVGLGVRQRIAEHAAQVARHPLGRVGEQRAVAGMDVRGDAARAAYRCHRERVVDVAVGQQHRGRPQPVLGQHRLEPVEHSDAGVHDQALLPRSGGEQVAVGPERLRRKPGHQHDDPPPLANVDAPTLISVWSRTLARGVDLRGFAPHTP
jgi:hypothetical protein